MNFGIALIDVRETTHRFLQRRCRRYVVPIGWLYENLEDLQSISQLGTGTERLIPS